MAQKRLEPTQEHSSPDQLLAWSKESGSPREMVLDMFGISWSTLQKWVRLWNTGGKTALLVGKPTGRPSHLTTEAKKFIVRTIEFTHPKTGQKITGTAISGTLKQNVRDHLVQKLGLPAPAPAGVPADPSPEDSSQTK